MPSEIRSIINHHGEEPARILHDVEDTIQKYGYDHIIFATQFSAWILISAPIINHRWNTSLGESMHKLLYSKLSFAYAGVDIVDKVDFATSSCGLLYPSSYGYSEKECRLSEECMAKYHISTKFTREISEPFQNRLKLFSERFYFNWTDFYVAHYRRGDVVANCGEGSRLNCRNMSSFVAHVRSLHPTSLIYIATNEKDKEQLKMLKEAKSMNVIGQYIFEDLGTVFYCIKCWILQCINSIKFSGISLSSYELLEFELQLFIKAFGVIFVEGVSSLSTFVTDARVTHYGSQQARIEYV